MIIGIIGLVSTVKPSTIYQQGLYHLHQFHGGSSGTIMLPMFVLSTIYPYGSWVTFSGRR